VLAAKLRRSRGTIGIAKSSHDVFTNLAAVTGNLWHLPGVHHLGTSLTIALSSWRAAFIGGSVYYFGQERYFQYFDLFSTALMPIITMSKGYAGHN